MPSSGSYLALACRFSKRSVRGRVSNPVVGIPGAQALSLFVNPMPPRTTEKSYRPRVSDRTMVDARTSVWLDPRFRIARETFPLRGKPESRNQPPPTASPMVGHHVAAPGGEMSMIRLGDRNTSRGIPSPRTGTAPGRGAECREPILGALQLEGEIFSLDIPSHRTAGSTTTSPRNCACPVGIGTAIPPPTWQTTFTGARQIPIMARPRSASTTLPWSRPTL